ncbi:MAG: hypothetical protein ACK5MP_01020 [Nostocoides sp.]
MDQADIEDGTRPGVVKAESQELKGLRRRNRLLEQWGCPRLRRRTRFCVGPRMHDDLAERNFSPLAPDLLWVADFERHEALLN